MNEGGENEKLFHMFRAASGKERQPVVECMSGAGRRFFTSAVDNQNSGIHFCSF